MITREQALNLNEFHHNQYKNKDGTCSRYRRNGKTRTWKTTRPDWYIPVKHGLYGYASIGHDEAEFFHVASECPQDFRECPLCGNVAQDFAGYEQHLSTHTKEDTTKKIMSMLR